MTDRYAVLKQEISDPVYAGKTDAEIAVMVNAKTVPAPIPAMIPIAEIMNAFDATELLAMPANQISSLNLLLRGDIVDVTANSSVRALFIAVFADKPNSLGKLAALVQQYDAATQPWTVVEMGVSSISDLDVAAARAL